MRPATIAAAGAALGFAALGVGFALEPARALLAWLFAFVLWLSVAMGALIAVMVCTASAAVWFVPVRRLGEAVFVSLPWFALAVLPLLAWSGHLFPWAMPLAELPEELRHAVAHQRPWMGAAGVAARTLAILAIWIALAEALRRWSRRQDASDDWRLVHRQRALSVAGLIVVGATLTVLAIDLVMALLPTFHSTVFGVYLAAGSANAGFALIALLAARAHRRRGEPSRDQLHALGKLLLVTTAFWAYLAFSQLIVIYQTDAPHKVVFYLLRTSGAWGPLGLVVAFGRFLLPFLALLPVATKRSPRALAAIAAWLLAMHAVEVYWLVIPALPHAPAAPHWMDAAAVLAVGGGAAALAAARGSRVPPVPVRDPLLARAREEG